MDKTGGYQVFPSKVFSSHIAENSVGESFTVAFFSGIEKVWIRGRGVVSRFSVENFSSHNAGSFRRGIYCCCINFGYQKSLDKTGGYQVFPSKVFSSHIAENSVGESFTVAFFSGIEKVWIRGRGVVSRFSFDSFLSHSAEISVGESFTVALISGI